MKKLAKKEYKEQLNRWRNPPSLFLQEIERRYINIRNNKLINFCKKDLQDGDLIEENWTDNIEARIKDSQDTKKLVDNKINQVSSQLEGKIYNFNSFEEVKLNLGMFKNNDIILIKGEEYKILQDDELIDDNEYCYCIEGNTFLVKLDINKHFQAKYKGIAISITTNENNYHLTQINNQINIAKKMKTSVQLAIGVTMGDKEVTGEISLCVTSDQLREIINIVIGNNLTVSMIKLHSQTKLGDWSGVDVLPTDYDVFFAKYNNILLQVGEICKEFNIPILVMCNEMKNIISRENYARWKNTISLLKNQNPNIKLGIAYTMARIREELINYNLTYSNNIPKLLDYVCLNVYPSVLRKNKKYNYAYPNIDYGLFNSCNKIDRLYDKDGFMKVILFCKDYFGNVIITENGCIQYDTIESCEINNMKAIADTSLRIGTEGKDQYEFFKECLPDLMSISDGYYIWGANAPFTPVNEGLNYLKNKMRSEI